MSVWLLVGETYGKANPKASCILWVLWTLFCLPSDLLLVRSSANAQMSSLTAKLLDFTARLSLPLLQAGLICYFKHCFSQYSRQSDSQKASFNFYLERARVTFSTESTDYSWHTILSLNYTDCFPATCIQQEYIWICRKLKSLLYEALLGRLVRGSGLAAPFKNVYTSNTGP